MSHKYKDLKKLAEANDFAFLRNSKGDHEIWVHSSGTRITLDRSGSRERRALQNFRSAIKRIVNSGAS